MKRRFALAGLVAALSVLSSFVIVFADTYPPTDTSYGWISHAKGCPFTNWVYVLPSDDIYDAYNIEEMLFWFVVGEEKTQITITETSKTQYLVGFEFSPQDMRYAAKADKTWMEIKMDDGEWVYAVGPAPMWRRGGG